MKGKFTKDYWIIKWSGLFYPYYYLKQYPDVRQADVDPLEHFVLHGWKEGRNPNDWFNTREYLEKNPDVAQAGVNPFVHWIRWGRFEGRQGVTLTGGKELKNSSSNLKKISRVLRLTRQNPHLVKRFVETLRSYGFSEAIRKTKDYLNKTLVDVPATKIITIDTIAYEPIEFKVVNKSKVTIIIPVHNKFDYTYKCLKSIYLHTNLEEIEIIIADDSSTDETINIHKYVKNVKIVRNEKPLGFLKNCNNASKYAKGKYILFLNNDTQVQPGWLDYLIETIESDDKIGLVGPKFVYPDGRLQEAGGIIWKDGTGWNYGRFDDPEKPEYNYLKEVDYISGACILIRKDLWEEIGGFDERFTPAYFEDTDLAFEVRRKGYKVIFQPKSIVVHFEGVSHGTDTSIGIKKYQEINRPQFVEKWKDILEQDHFNKGEHVFLARDRSRRKLHILVIDHYVPHFDQDAGSRTIFTWLKIFTDLGFKVTFIGDNFFKHEPYTSILQNMGIEVLYGQYYADKWQEWLGKNLQYFDYVLLSRSWISMKYMNYIEKIKKTVSLKTRIIYYPHDLSFLRLYREYEVTKNSRLLEEAEKLKEAEFRLFERSNIIILLSSFERDYIKQYFLGKDIRLIMPFAYQSNEIPLTNANFEERSGLLFVGGFRHIPNYYGVKWFLESGIWDYIKKAIDGVKFYIVGSEMPDDIKRLSALDKQIEALGYVTDSTLKELYNKVRIVVSPLTFGAGLKGKIAEAIAMGVPIVTTSIGAEGYEKAEEIMLVADKPEDFAKLIADIYLNKNKWYEIRNNQIKYAKSRLSYESVIKMWREIFGLDKFRLVAEKPTDEKIKNEIIIKFSSHEAFKSFITENKFLISKNYIEELIHDILKIGIFSPLTNEYISPDEIIIEHSNYRETIKDKYGLISRHRAVLKVLKMFSEERKENLFEWKIYCPEAITNFALYMRGKFPFFLGSEYGVNPDKFFPIPVENLMNLSFKDESFDAIICNDVFEHIPDIKQALDEIFRVLKKGGFLVSTFPFNYSAYHNIIKAILNKDGTIEYLQQPPEYHGNPVGSPSLVFLIPGWEVLDIAKKVGFSESSMYFISSAKNGIVGQEIAGVFVFTAEK